MARRGENIRKRKDGRWEGRYKNGTKKDGSVRYSSVYGKSYSEVKEKLRSREQVLYTSFYTPHTDMKFREILQLWMSNSRIKNKGATEHKYHFMVKRHIEPELGNIRVSTLKASVINTFLDQKLRDGRLDGNGGLSPSYIKTLSVIINSALRYAASEGLCMPLNASLYKPPIIRKEMHILDKKSQKRLEQQLSFDMDGTRLGILLALQTGMRIGEICALSWEDIDLCSKVIHIRHTIARVKSEKEGSKKTQLILDDPKTKSAIRDIPISTPLLPVLYGMKERSGAGYLISGKMEFVSTRTFDYRYKKILEKTGIPLQNFHSLRHTFATRCVEAGMDVKTLSEILGHSNVSITLNTYVHPSLERKREQMEKFCALSA